MESISKIRARRLRQWIDERCGGSQTTFILGTDLSTSQLGQWLGGHRNMGEGSARSIEQKKRMPPRWLDGQDESEHPVLTAIKGLQSVDARALHLAIQFQSLSEHHRRIVEAVVAMPPPEEENKSDDAPSS